MDHHHIVLGTELGALVVVIALGIWRISVTHRHQETDRQRSAYGAPPRFDMRRDGQRPDL